MTTVASAPGKLLLLGEYAVLRGAPALVAAVDRRARVTVADDAPGRFRVDAPALAVRSVTGRFTANGQPHFDDGRTAAGELSTIAHALADLPPAADSAGYHIHIDTDGFHDHDRGVKFGIGSSSATMVALAGALRAHTGRSSPGLDALVRLHRRAQGGSGSGVDIAAGLRGGTLACRSSKSGVAAATAALPPDFRWRCIWTGRPASTPALLSEVADWAGRRPRQHAALMNRLTRAAEDGAAAASASDSAALLAAMNRYGGLVDELDKNSGAHIVTDEHRRLVTLAKASGVVYKSSGAGGGDIGIVAAARADALEEFTARAGREGFLPLELAVEQHGLEIDLGE